MPRPLVFVFGLMVGNVFGMFLIKPSKSNRSTLIFIGSRISTFASDNSSTRQ